MHSEQKAPPLGSMLGGRYRLLRFLGSGATSAVYEAATPSDERVAVKVLFDVEHRRLATQLQQRFIREAGVTSTFDSAHVVRVEDSGMDDEHGVPYLVMPLLSGTDLDAVLERCGAMHPTVAVRIMVQACSGIMDAHKAGVVHRDIKPGNIFLDHDASGGIVVRVCDFGMAKATADDDGITRAGSALGTPHYMSPEQSTNAMSVDARSDVWGIAATLYHLLTGCAPFNEATTFADLHLSLNTQDVPSIQGRAPWIDPGLATVVHGALLRDLNARCPSVGELRLALVPYVAGATDVNTMMLMPAPPLLASERAEVADTVTSWLRRAPTGKLPTISAEPVDDLLGKRMGDKYLLARRLGSGSTASLYEAIGPDANRFAVRVVNTSGQGAQSAATKRFVREARALAAIARPHIVKLVDAAYDEVRAQPYCVLELLYGQDLGRLIAKHGPVDPRVLVPIAVQGCDGLEAAHQHGIIHRDIRPDNLFLVEETSGDVTVKLTGFGQVRCIMGEDAAQALTMGSDLIGTPMYMSPEQARDATTADVRSDVYSMGALIFHALAGVPIWPEGLRPADLLVEIARGRPAHLQDHAPWIDTALTEVVHKALKPEPAERWPTVAALRAALMDFAASTRLNLQDIRPLSSTMRKRVAPRAEPIVAAVEAAVTGSIDVAESPLPVAASPADETVSSIGAPAHSGAAARRRTASRVSSILGILFALIAIAAVAAYAGWKIAAP